MLSSIPLDTITISCPSVINSARLYAVLLVIGAGSWGTALAVVLAHNGHNVTVWSILEDEVEMLTKEHEHKDKLPGVKIPETISFTTDLYSHIIM